MSPCMFPGCQNGDATNVVGIRLRYPPQQNAVWAPDTEGYLCDAHARTGWDIVITMQPTAALQVATHVSVLGGPRRDGISPIDVAKLP